MWKRRGQDLEVPPGVRLLRTLKGHKGRVRSVVFDPAGGTLASGSDDQTVKLWEVASGRLLRTLEGHQGSVRSVAFNPMGGTLASGNTDQTVKLWEVASGRLLSTLEGQKYAVWSVAFDPAGGILASGSADGTILLRDSSSGRLLCTLEGHEGDVNCVAFDPAGRTLASGSSDETVKLWDSSSGRLLRTLEGHQSWVRSVAFDPEGSTLASGSLDRTIKLWDSSSGRLLRTLEGHTNGVGVVAISPDGQLLASKGADGTVRLWRCDTGGSVVVVPEPSHRDYWIPAMAFHPTLPWLATAGSPPGTSVWEQSQLIHIWELDLDVLLGKVRGAKAPPPAVHHTTAKIVLVGDSGVGKTGLGWRLAHGQFKEHASTHGQQFWVLNQLCGRRTDGTECEAIVWDLAGQPDYRLIHALFLDDADLALVLFDPTDTRDPLHGVEFWLRQLSSCGAVASSRSSGLPVVLVGARTDRGSPTLTSEELEAFCRQQGICGFVSTSALTGEGLEELIARMKTLIPWDDKPATVTTTTFKRIKDFVLELKEQRQEGSVVVTPLVLRQRLEQTDATWQFTDDEMMTAVGHLENYGYVKRLRTSKGVLRILLSPELLNNLAASFVLEARRNPKGLGTLEERRLLEGGYAFRELERLSPEERAILLDSAALLFLEHHVCFRETDPLTGQSYLVFPELINLKKPLLDNEPATEDGVAYTVSGAVENVFASLVVLLGYTHTFTRTNQWHNHARYEVAGGLVCGFRQDAERDGELDFVLYFGHDVGRPVRTLFQGLFESFLARRNLTVLRYEPVRCSKGHQLNRAVVRELLQHGEDSGFCSKCGERLALPKTEEPIQMTRQQEAEVDTQRRAADQRTRFEQAVFRVQAYVKEQGIKVPECFISYAWGEKDHERWVEKSLATDLQKAGISVVLDRWENSRVGASVSRFVERIERCDLVIVVGTPLLRRKYEYKETSTGYVVATEVDVIASRLLGTEAQKETVLPVLRAGEKTSSLPPLLHGRVYADFRDEQGYFLTAFDLILDLYGISHGDTAVADLRESLMGSEMR